MENNEEIGVSPPEPQITIADNIKNFYKGDFKNIFNIVFRNPIDGIYSLLEKPSEKAYSQSLILFSSVFVIYLIGGFFLVGESRRYMEFGDFVKISIIPVIMMIVISSLSFAIKSISGKPNFKNELLTGGLCAFPIGLLIPVLIVVKILFSKNNILELISNPMAAGMIGFLPFFYLVLMLINIFQQSLKSAGTKDAIAWYLSPASIILSIYITFQIVNGILS